MYFCIEKDCQATTRLIRELSQLSEHQGHRNQPLSKFTETTVQRYKLDSVTSFEHALSAESQRLSIQQICSEMKFAIDQFQQSLLRDLNQVYDRRQNKLRETVKHIQTGNYDQIEQESLNDLFQLSEHGPSVLISSYAQETLYCLEQIKDRILQLIKPEKEQSKKQIEFSYDDSKFSRPNMQWSDEYKHKTVSIQGNLAKGNSNFDSHGGFVLVSLPLSKIGTSCCTFKIVRTSQTDCPLGIGITYRPSREKLGYSSIYHMNSGHGAYLITQKGSAWNDSGKPNQNASFKLQEKDLLEVVYNPKVNVVTFRKISEKGTPIFSMKLGEKFGGFHHFCAVLDNAEIELHQ